MSVLTRLFILLSVLLTANQALARITKCSAFEPPAVSHGQDNLSAIRSALTRYETALRNEIEPYRVMEVDDTSVVVDTDPLACRFCIGASKILIEWLRRDFPDIGWRLVRTGTVRSDSFDWRMHVFIYADALDLIVDPTYRQGLIGTPEFNTLPKIFAGTPQDLKKVFEPHLSPFALSTLLSFAHFHEHVDP